MGNFTDLNELISISGNELILNKNYKFNSSSDKDIDGFTITNDNYVVDGQGYTIDGSGQVRIFLFTGSNVTLKNINIINARGTGGPAAWFASLKMIDNCSFINNSASGSGGAIFINNTVSNCKINATFINNSARAGGAIFFNGETTNITINGYFKSNVAERTGGAINFRGKSTNNTFASEFYSNQAKAASGGAMFFTNLAENNLIESTFRYNKAAYGGGIFFYNKANNNKFNSDFRFNIAESCGGAMFFYSTTNNNNFTGYFINNSALGKIDVLNGNGGAITFKNTSSNSIFTCDFINNTAHLYGGGVNYRETPYNITFNSNFINNEAKTGGGVNFFKSFENVIFNREFNNNSAEYGGGIALNQGVIENVTLKNNHATSGGAIYFRTNGTVINSQFMNNTAEEEGAIHMYSGNVTNCNFNNNKATNNGGAIFMYSGSVENCNFIGNNATSGSAIYFYSNKNTKSISNSLFLNNRANADANNPFNININDNNIEIIFMGQDNLINAIYSQTNVTFTNVTYWGAKGITNTDESTPVKSNREAGQNVTVGVIINDVPVLNDVKVTDENGTIVLENIHLYGNYYISARHDDDSYYTEAEKIISKNMKYSVNVTSVTTNNRTVNITAKSNISGDIILGKLRFILPNNTEIDANYASNGTWWAVHTFNNYTEYNISATHSELDNVTVSNGTITLTRADSTITLDDIVLNYGESINVTVTTKGAIGITAKIDENYVDVVDNFTIPISDLGVGNYTLTVTTIADYDHNSVNKTVKITVNKATTQILANETLDLKVNNRVSDFAQLSPSDAGNLTCVSSNESVVLVSYDGVIYAHTKGTATVTVSFEGNENYTAAENKTITVTVTLKDASVSVENDTLNLNVDERFDLNATTVPDFINIDYISSNESVATVNDYGIVTAVGEGTAIITLTVGNNVTYALNSTTVTVNVKKIDTTIDVDEKSLDLKVNDNSKISANLTPADAGNLTFTSSNSSVASVDNQGNVIANGKGQVIITVSFSGDDKYAAAENKTITVNVSLNDASVTVDNDTLDLKVDERYAINATKNPDTILLDITYTSSNNSVATVDEKGIVTAVGEGTAIITVEVGDDEIYAKNSTNVTVNVKKDTQIIVSAPDVTKYYMGPERFVVTVTDSDDNPLADQSVSISICGVTYSRTTDVNGTASIAICLVKGEYNVTTVACNNTVYSKITVLPTVNATDLVKVFRNATQFYATFKDSEGNYLAEGTTVRFNIHGVFYDREISGDKGLAKLNINLEQGEYIITAMNLKTGANATNNITVISRLIENKDLIRYYRNASQFTVMVIGDDGKAVGANETVTFNINGMLYNRTTNESGIAKLNINLHPGNYIITAEYKNCRVSNNIKVLPILSADDLTKKYGAPDQFIATLVDGQGKAFAGQTVQFNINGVLYNKITDDNGQAKLNIRLMPGKYIITSSYGGTSIANNIIVSA